MGWKVTHLCHLFRDVVFHVVHGEEEPLLAGDDAGVRLVRLVEKHVVVEVVEAVRELRAVLQQLGIARRLVQNAVLHVIPCRCCTVTSSIDNGLAI